MAGSATGMVVGGVQGLLLLRRSQVRVRRWLAASVVALLLVHALGDMLPDSVALPLMLALGGLMLGGAQWWGSRWPARVGLVWTAVSTLSWAISFWLAYRIGHTTGDWRTEHLLVGAAVGIGLGIATATLWLWTPLRESSGWARLEVGRKPHAHDTS